MPRFAEALLCSFLLATTSHAAVQWPVSAGGNDHWYDVVRPASALIWDAAKTDAESRGGTLAVLNTQAEHDFVFANLVSNPLYWSETATITAGPVIGLRQANITNEPAGGWEWVTGEPLTYSSWAQGEPNNSGGVENYARFYNPFWITPTPTWNDYGGTAPSYVIEYAAPAPVSIAEARMKPVGSLVTIEAPVSFAQDLVQNTLLRDFALQDQSGGISVFAPGVELLNLAETLSVGDQLRVTGVVEHFNGYVQINARRAQFHVERTGSAAPPAAQRAIPADFAPQSTSAEALEYEIVELANMRFSPTPGQLFTDFTNYNVAGGGRVTVVRTPDGTAGTKIPDVPVALTGLVIQFDPSNPAPGVAGARYQIALNGWRLSGDFSRDGAVDGTDFLAWQRDLSSTTLLAADATGDGAIDAGDLAILLESFGAITNGDIPNGAASDVVIVSEPQAGLLGSSCLGIWIIFRRSKCRPTAAVG